VSNVTLFETVNGVSGSLTIEGETFPVLCDARIRQAPGRGLGEIEADLRPETDPHHVGHWVNGKNGAQRLKDGSQRQQRMELIGSEVVDNPAPAKVQKSTFSDDR
jgi:hypothetical protein